MAKSSIPVETLTAAAISAATRGEHTRASVFAEGVWMLTQQKFSRVSAFVDHVSISGESKEFLRTKPRRFKEKTKRLMVTEYEDQVFDSRMLYTKEYDDAAIASLGDMVESRVDFFSVVNKQTPPALARLMDEVCLGAIVAPVRASKEDVKQEDFTATSAGSGDPLSGRAGAELKYKEIVWLLKDTPASREEGGDTVYDDGVLFDVSCFDKIAYILSEKEIDIKGTVVGLTPKVILALRSDAAFRNKDDTRTNQLYGTPHTTADDQFEMAGLTCIKLNANTLPTINANNLASADPSGGKAVCVAKKLSAVKDVGGKSLSSALVSKSDLATPAAMTAAHNTDVGSGSSDADRAQGAHYQKVSFSDRDVVYVWKPEAVKFARQRVAEIKSKHVRHDLREARAVYMLVRIGAMLLDEDYAMVIPSFGSGAD